MQKVFCNSYRYTDKAGFILTVTKKPSRYTLTIQGDKVLLSSIDGIENKQVGIVADLNGVSHPIVYGFGYSLPLAFQYFK